MRLEPRVISPKDRGHSDEIAYLYVEAHEGMPARAFFAVRGLHRHRSVEPYPDTCFSCFFLSKVRWASVSPDGTVKPHSLNSFSFAMILAHGREADKTERSVRGMKKPSIHTVALVLSIASLLFSIYCSTLPK